MFESDSWGVWCEPSPIGLTEGYWLLDDTFGENKTFPVVFGTKTEAARCAYEMERQDGGSCSYQARKCITELP